MEAGSDYKLTMRPGDPSRKKQTDNDELIIDKLNSHNLPYARSRIKNVLVHYNYWNSNIIALFCPSLPVYLGHC